MAEPRILVAGASGYTGALAARLVDRHPAFELHGVTSRSDAGRALSELYPHHRVDTVLRDLDLDRDGEVTSRDAVLIMQRAYLYYPKGKQ